MVTLPSAPRILIVDDDPVNREVLADYLDDTGYELIMAEHGLQVLDYLQRPDARADAILLDWMMPEMDGITMVGRLHDLDRIASVPIIMQTAVDSPDRIREGLEAGVFYYLVKPFNSEILKAVVKAAVRRHQEYEQRQRDLEDQAFSLTFMDSAVFRVRTLSEVHALALLLAKACPNPDRVIMGLTDLLINAVEHGNLGISYDEKTRLQEEECWEEEIERRLAFPEYRDKRVTVEFVRRDGAIWLTIHDEGQGFDWRPYLTMRPDMLLAGHGRGIAMAKALAFDDMEYHGNGNTVVCRIQERTGDREERKRPNPEEDRAKHQQETSARLFPR